MSNCENCYWHDQCASIEPPADPCPDYTPLNCERSVQDYIKDCSCKQDYYYRNIMLDN